MRVEGVDFLLCACCSQREATELHHLYAKSHGCPDDLTVLLCGVCHGRAHQMRHRAIDIRQLTTEGLARAKLRGVKLGNPQIRAGTAEMAMKAASAHRAKAAAKRADVLPFIRQAQAAGATTLQAICDAMVARGISTPGGRGCWHPSTVSRLLKVAA